MCRHMHSLTLCVFNTMPMTRILWLVPLSKTTKGADSLDFSYPLD